MTKPLLICMNKCCHIITSDTISNPAVNLVIIIKILGVIYKSSLFSFCIYLHRQRTVYLAYKMSPYFKGVL